MSTVLLAARTITAEDIAACARLTGDHGSHHVSGLAGRQMAQGLLTLAAAPLLASAHVRSMSLRFSAPVFAEDTITASVEITDRVPEPDGVLVTCELRVVNAAGADVITGSGTALVVADVPPAVPQADG